MTDDLDVMRQAVIDNPEDDGALAALVDLLQERELWWEFVVRQSELKQRLKRKDSDRPKLRRNADAVLDLGLADSIELLVHLLGSNQFFVENVALVRRHILNRKF